MTQPYLLISDTHYHAWDAFSTINPDGVNSRLQIILDETKRAFDTLREAGGSRVFHAGDMFHTRGSLAPSVLNPVISLYCEASRDLTINAIAGNHDLESNETTWLTAATSASGVRFTEGVTDCGDVVLVNWHSDVPRLMDTINSIETKNTRHEVDLIIHAPVDDVLTGIPSHGLSAPMLARTGFKRIFAGHYHNHKDFDNGVYSIGALTHQTWSDVQSKAGFLLVYPDRVERFASHAPSFVDIPLDLITSDDIDLMELCDGNYVRTTIDTPSAEIEAVTRERLMKAGALAVLLRSQKVTDEMTHRREETTGSLESLQDAVLKYARLKGGEKLAEVCDKIMKEVC